MSKNNKQKLELTWIGKNNPEYDIANIEPRILEEDPNLSNCKNDPNTENMIIHGGNLAKRVSGTLFLLHTLYA